MHEMIFNILYNIIFSIIGEKHLINSYKNLQAKM